MTKIEMTETIILAKSQAALSWEDLAQHVGISPVFLTSAALGKNSLKAEPAKKLCEVLSLGDEVSKSLQAYPMKEWDKIVPNDPLIYRFYEGAIGLVPEKSFVYDPKVLDLLPKVE